MYEECNCVFARMAARRMLCQVCAASRLPGPALTTAGGAFTFTAFAIDVKDFVLLQRGPTAYLQAPCNERVPYPASQASASPMSKNRVIPMPHTALSFSVCCSSGR